jgi:hypothetical protein
MNENRVRIAAGSAACSRTLWESQPKKGRVFPQTFVMSSEVPIRSDRLTIFFARRNDERFFDCARKDKIAREDDRVLRRQTIRF